MDFPKAGDLQSETTCSVCLELVTHERSMAKLICGHMFHLDCVGSAFNAKGSMQCPNCRRIENGNWLYGNGRPHHDNSTLHNMMFEEEYNVEYEMFARVSELFVPEDYVSHWCPYQGMYTRVSMSLGNEDRPPTPYPEVEVDMLVGEDLESTLLVQPSPSAHARAPRRASGVEENVNLPASSARLRRAAAYQQHLSPSIEREGRQSLEAVEPNGVAGGIGVEEVSAGRSRPGQSSRRRRSLLYPGSSTPASQLLPRPSSWHYTGIPAMQDAVREPQARSFTNSRQRQRDGSSRFGQHPSEAGGQRWEPPPLLGLPGTHSSRVSQIAHSDSHVQARSGQQVQALLHLHPSGENIGVQHPRSSYHPLL